ncbi:winged helix-turn-helix domain-containing protein [Arthrobacter sp. NPDC092385]|uniref:GntR family transcriptional regulator n=1 Tax=Arthrobacter sp. NPDC092385 TaxID=3363943 RepID=UPI00130EDF0A|nr:GntR family transcriptional regulator [Vibrio cholerae]
MASIFQYETIYQALRARIEAGEFTVGDQLPSIAALQDEYGVKSLGTIRAAHQMLIEDGLVRSEQGRGVFVTSTESSRGLSVDDTLAAAIEQLQRVQRAVKAQRIRRVTIDLNDPEHRHAYGLLTDTLREEAARRREDAEDGNSFDAETSLEVAQDADWIVGLVEAALENTEGLS